MLHVPSGILEATAVDLRAGGALEFDPTPDELLAINRQQVEAWILKDHWLTHLPAHPSCASCGRAKLKREGAYATSGAEWEPMERLGIAYLRGRLEVGGN